jgi:hypothetical protein
MSISRRACAGVAALVAAGTVLLTLGGCTVNTGEREAGSAKVEQMREQGRTEFDLTSPPSRVEAGLPAGRSEVTYELSDRQAFRVRVGLPDGHELDLDARLAVFDSIDAPEPATGPPTTLDLHHYPATLAAGRDHLLAAAAEFGLDPTPIEQWYEQASGDRPVEAPSTVRTPWLTTTVGYLNLQLQGRYAPPVDTPDSDRMVVHYSFTWQASPSS